jgi:arsenate reductase
VPVLTTPLIYSYGPCGTCRKALAWLQGRGVQPRLIDITLQPPSSGELAEALRQFGDRRPLLNTSGASYRALGAERVRAMTDAQILEALAADGRLIKRPFLVLSDGTILTGFRPEVWEPLFPPPQPR